MSLHELIEVECPKCNRKQEFSIWKSINVTINPEGKTDLLEGRINHFTCQDCGFSGYVSASLLYHDMGKRFSVNYIPADNLSDEEYVKQVFTPEGKINISIPFGMEQFARTDYFSNAHIVFSMDELVKYILFRDRISEVFGSG